MNELIWQYANAAVLLPAAVLEHMDKAGKKELRVLLALGAEPLSHIGIEAAAKRVAERTRLTPEEVASAIAFWRGAGVLVAAEGASAGSPASQKAISVPAVKEVRPVADRGLPQYSSAELSAILERRAELGALINECQQTFGKIFNAGEVATLVGMADYLGLDGEYILLLLAHCVRMEKKSLRYVEKMAISLHDEGVHDTAALEERLLRIETMAGAMGRIRAMFGLSGRALTTKEKTMIEKWVCTMRYTDDILKKAYEITVDSIGKASIPYTNTILERWFAEGYRTLSDIENAIADYRRKKSDGSSFDVDDFFEAAVKRTYGEA